MRETVTGNWDAVTEAMMRMVVREELAAVLEAKLPGAIADAIAQSSRIAVLPMVLSRKAAAEQLSVSPKVLHKLIANGSIRATKVGGRYGVHRRELERFAEPPDPKGPRGPRSKRRAKAEAAAQAEAFRRLLRAR